MALIRHTDLTGNKRDSSRVDEWSHGDGFVRFDDVNTDVERTVHIRISDVSTIREPREEEESSLAREAVDKAKSAVSGEPDRIKYETVATGTKTVQSRDWEHDNGLTRIELDDETLYVPTQNIAWISSQ